MEVYIHALVQDTKKGVADMKKVVIFMPKKGQGGYTIRYDDDPPVLITKVEILDELRQLL